MLFLYILWNCMSDATFEYTDAEETIISKVFLGDQDSPTIQIPSNIIGFDTASELNGPFTPIKSRLKSISFLSDSQVTSIGDYLFYKCIELTSVDMSECSLIKEIKTYAFAQCSHLNKILFPPNLEVLHSYCFNYCTELGDVELPNTTRIIGIGSFRENNAMTTFTVPLNLIQLKESALNRCYQLRSFICPENCSLMEIGSWCFVSTPLTELYVPSSVTIIGSSIIEENTNVQKITLQEPSNFAYAEPGLLMNKDKTIILFGLAKITGTLTIPDYITQINGNCFKSIRISSAIMPDSVSILSGSDHFASCRSLVTLKLSRNLKMISPRFVQGCSLLSSLTVEGNVTSIGQEAFNGCSSLMFLKLPSTVTVIYQKAFAGVPSDISITFGDDAGMFIKDNFIFSAEQKTIVAYLDDQESVQIPVNTTLINGYTFSFKSLKNIEFDPQSKLKEIGTATFKGCTNLEAIKLPPTVQTVGYSAFEGCTALKNITLGDSLNVISEMMFSKAFVGDLIVPSTVHSILNSAFHSSNISSITFKKDSNLIFINESAFASTKQLIEISLPINLAFLDSKSFYQSGVSTVIFIPQSKTKEIPIMCFCECTKLTKINLPEFCSTISDSSFENCESLETVELPKTVSLISYKAFYGCKNLRKFSIPSYSQLDTINGQAFGLCKSLKNFDASEFSGLVSEEGLLMDSQRTKIIAFLPASTRRILILEDSVTAVANFAFQGASNLEAVVIPSSVRRIGLQAFEGCSSLSMLNISTNPDLEIASEAFSGCNLFACECVHIEGGLNPSVLIKSGVSKTAFELCPSLFFTQHGDFCTMDTLFIPFLAESE